MESHMPSVSNFYLSNMFRMERKKEKKENSGPSHSRSSSLQVDSEQHGRSNSTKTVPDVSKINLDENSKEEASSFSMKNVIKTAVLDSSTTKPFDAVETSGETINGVQEYAKRKPILRSMVPFDLGYS